LPDQWKESIIVLVHKKGGKIIFSNYCGLSLLSTSCKILSNVILSWLSPCVDENRAISVGVDVTDQVLIRSLRLSYTGEKMGVQ
jgi:hypothetical protein